jgi:hypothetical protein
MQATTQRETIGFIFKRAMLRRLATGRKEKAACNNRRADKKSFCAQKISFFDARTYSPKTFFRDLCCE